MRLVLRPIEFRRAQPPVDFPSSGKADLYNASLWRGDAVMQPESRDAHRRLLAQGWTDSTRQRQGRKDLHLLHYGIAFCRNQGFRMDFLPLSPALSPNLQDAGVDTEFRAREKAGDHAPAWMTLKRLSGKPRPAARATLARTGAEPQLDRGVAKKRK